MSQETIQAIRGMKDLIPNEIEVWHFIEKTLISILQQYGYQEIRLPIVEKTELFKRSIGEVTDIVEKEMYTFLDRNEESLTLRPEGTAGCVRAVLEHSLLHHTIQKLWYTGPMFRYERPQKGRYRQFYQFGVEAFGIADPTIDAEMIQIGYRLFRTLKLDPFVKLMVNSIGSSDARQHYKKRLVEYFQDHFEALDPDSQRRLETNPLRILDSKNESMKSLIEQAPKLTEALDEVSKHQFETVCSYLNALGIAYEINPYLVRGLDYYNGTVFEWVADIDAAQSAVCAGGRYDGLIAQMGGAPTPAFGFAIGLERLVYCYQTKGSNDNHLPVPQLYVMTLLEEAIPQTMMMVEKWREQFPSLCCVTDFQTSGIKSKFRRADKSEAVWAMIVGEEELKTKKVTIKNLRHESQQETISWENIPEWLTKIQ